MTVRRRDLAGAAAPLAGLVLVLGAGAGACSDGAEASPAIEVVAAVATPGEGSIAVYLTLDNDGGADRLTGAALVGADADRAGSVSLHGTDHEEGLSVMHHVHDLEVAAGTSTALEPGGDHIMVEGLTAPVEVGETLRLRLDFERSDPIEADVEVVPTDEVLERTGTRPGARGGERP